MIELNNQKMYFADLHIHSRFSRACSKDLNLETLEKWAKIKGLDSLGTGDFTHPIWLDELKNNLIEKQGIYYTKNNFPFILTGEVSLMYTQGRGRKVHLVLFAPSFEAVDKINSWLDTKGRRDYDGRPIFKISCEDFVAKMNSIDERIEIIPAHCLLPDTLIQLNKGVKKIKDIKTGEKVLTHRGTFRKIKKVFVREYSGETIKIVPWYFREGLETTPEHPFFAIKSYKKCPSTKGLCNPLCSKNSTCARRHYKNYNLQWIQAKDIETGDFLVYPRFKKEKDLEEIDLTDYLDEYKLIDGDFIITKNGRNHTGKIKRYIKIDEEFCRLIGYFLSEGYVSGNSGIGFSFHCKEKEYIREVISAIKNSFGFNLTKFDSRRENQGDLVFSSKLLNSFFKNFYLKDGKRAGSKYLSDEFLYLAKTKIAEILRGWWRGDTGYTTSRQLANQMKLICLKLGIIPSINIDRIEDFEKRGKHFIGNRKIKAKNDLVIFSNLSFFEEDYGMLNENCFKKFVNKKNMKHGWIDENYVYLPVRKIEKKNYNGSVYNLEVEKDNSYVSEFACVHNCWTPHFGVFGSESGFDSLKEAFGSQVEKVHAIETGISSDRNMNFRINELKNRAIVSFSDSHSYWPWRLGREATILKSIENYNEILKEIRENDFLGTIEVDPAYGKYHFDGHMDCGFSSSPEETKKLNGVCPKCKKPLTIGVENRVKKLRNDDEKDRKLEFKILPLHEILSLGLNSGMNTKKVWGVYNELISEFKNELNVLLVVEKEKLFEFIDEEIVDLILKNRKGEIKVRPGYDGVYGVALLNKENYSQEKLFSN